MDAMFHNMVSERYPRDEDDDASASASDIDADEDSVDADSAPAIQEPSASHDCIRFGSFDSPIIPVSTPSIEPKFDGFSVKIGEISCVLVTSCNDIVDDDDSVLVVHEDDEKLQVLEPELKNRCSDFVVSEASEDFVIHTAPVRLRSAVYGGAALRPFASWLFVGKQPEQPVFTVNNQLRVFELHDESIVVFDPGGRFGLCSLFFVSKTLQQIRFRLWWIPWDRGRHMWIPVKSLPFILLISQIFRIHEIHEIHEILLNLSKKSAFLELLSELCFKFFFDHHSIRCRLQSHSFRTSFCISCFQFRSCLCLRSGFAVLVQKLQEDLKTRSCLCLRSGFGTLVQKLFWSEATLVQKQKLYSDFSQKLFFIQKQKLFRRWLYSEAVLRPFSEASCSFRSTFGISVFRNYLLPITSSPTAVTITLSIFLLKMVMPIVLLPKNLLASRSPLLSLNVSKPTLRKDMVVEKQIQLLPKV
jgi:hypothetical protein